MTAKQFIEVLSSERSTKELENNKRFYAESGKDKVLGVRMKIIFDTAKKFVPMPVEEIEKLFKSPYYEVRMGAVSIMDFQARKKNISDVERKTLYQLYLDNHKRINNWDLIDRSAPHVVGGYLTDKSRTMLYKLAKSKSEWERRTAIVSTWYFIRQNDVEDTFAIAELMVKDKSEYVQKAVGSWVREAGKRDKKRLLKFLDTYSPVMPRTMLRYAIEKLDKKQKEYYMKSKITD